VPIDVRLGVGDGSLLLPGDYSSIEYSKFELALVSESGFGLQRWRYEYFAGFRSGDELELVNSEPEPSPPCSRGRLRFMTDVFLASPIVLGLSVVFDSRSVFFTPEMTNMSAVYPPPVIH